MYQLKALKNFSNSSLNTQFDIWIIRLSHKTTKEHQMLENLKNSLKFYETSRRSRKNHELY